MINILARTVRDARFAPETSALLDLIGPQAGPITYDDLVADRASPPDPEVAGHAEPVRVRTDLLLVRGESDGLLPWGEIDGLLLRRDTDGLLLRGESDEPLPHQETNEPLLRGKTPLRVRLYRHAVETPRPLLLWLHGGAFVGGSLADVDVACSALARRAGVNVASLDYRLAPEHPFPAALHDTYDAFQWLAANGAAIGGDGRVAAGGQSAGANLVAAACLLARDRGGAQVLRQILCYPALDFGRDTESSRLFDGVLLDSSLEEWYEAQYLAGQPVTPYAAPLRAQTVEGLPPALILGAGRDPLRDEAREYAGRLDQAGVDVSYLEYEDTMHAFLNFPGALSAAGQAIRDIADDLGRFFATNDRP
ncbi:alpha/beta hydrolase [Acrocarpospora corrugata]|uniref:Alpha/beta hydrolase n=1 Tax=Acrocarpospora corrugata TaxID=35763 RepID=A0A5M3WEG8_9ACTN|nr:alpha/beta hydrolase [Acrocarpospora corrugata]GES04738.1 alpha/beta hydrolase [Acrocarpospora corrugata]